VGLTFPEGKRFAFTIMDDTDVATLENVGPMYRLLDQLGFRTTKTVWPVGCPEGSPDFGTSATLEDAAYLDFVRDVERRGFEIAYHGATMESSVRERTLRAFERYRALFGGPPVVFANHACNRENLYWGVQRLDSRLLRALYARVTGRTDPFSQGHVPGSAWWWGDLAGEMTYVRNLTFDEINLARINPSMPYHDPRRPLVKWWFSASDAENVEEFNELIAPAAQDRLEQEGGVCIVATHLGKGFATSGGVHPETHELLERLAAKPGWFVPVGELLDWLRERRRGDSSLPQAEWRRMQWRWARDLVRRQLRLRRRRSAAVRRSP
jgi:hypothetical protein